MKYCRSGSRRGFRFLGENETLRAFRYGKSDTYFPLDPYRFFQLFMRAKQGKWATEV